MRIRVCVEVGSRSRQRERGKGNVLAALFSKAYTVVSVYSFYRAYFLESRETQIQTLSSIV